MLDKIPASQLCGKPKAEWARDAILVVLAGLVGLILLYLVVSECLFYVDHPDIRRGDVGFGDPELHLADKILEWGKRP